MSFYTIFFRLMHGFLTETIVFYRKMIMDSNKEIQKCKPRIIIRGGFKNVKVLAQLTSGLVSSVGNGTDSRFSMVTW